mgnify:CR=1 FL=1
MTFSSWLEHQKLLLVFFGISVINVVLPPLVSACSVCFGATKSEVFHGLQAGILLLIGMTAIVFIGIGGFLLAARHRLQRLESEPTEVQR